MKNMGGEPERADEAEMLPEYDFTGGIRGKHYQSYRAGHTATVHRADGTKSVQHFKLEEGAVMLDPEVRQYFPDSETVNHALRMLISLIPHRDTRTPSE